MAGSIVDYASLQAAVANWMVRSGNTDFTGNTPDFVGFAEDDFNFGYDDPVNPEFNLPPLRTQQMEVTSFTLVLPNSTNTAVLPSDFLQLRRLFFFDASGQRHKLTYATPDELDSSYGNFPSGPQAFYTIMSDAILLAANVQTTTTLIGGYYQQIPALSTSNTVNWLLQKRPSLYHARTMFHAALFVGDNDEAIKWARISAGAVRSFNKQDLKGKYSGDALQMKTDVGNP